MISTPEIHAITWVAIHLPAPQGWKAELARLVDLYDGQFTHKVVTSTVDQGKSASQRPTSLPLSHAASQLPHQQFNHSSSK